MKNFRRFLPALAALFALLFSAAGSLAQTSEDDKKRAWQELLTFKNQDLFAEKARESRKKVDKLFNQLVFQGKELREREDFPFFVVRYIWETGAENKNGGYAVMESQNFIILPGQQRQSFYFFDRNGKLLNKEQFSTGWRMIVTGVELIKRDDFEFPMVKITAVGGGGFAFAGKTVQYYALLEDTVVLIRLEFRKASSSRILDKRNAYGCEYPAIGPKMPERNVDEWVKAVNADDKVEILRALMWLAGLHKTMDELNREQKAQEELRKQDAELGEWKTTLERCPEIVREIQTYESVKNLPDVQKRLKELTKSSNQWIKEAAEVALTPIDFRRGF